MFKRKIAALLFVVIIISLGLTGHSSLAANSEITISIEVGIQGKIKSDKGFPLLLTVENKGEDFKGDLLVNFFPNYQSGGAKLVHLEIGKGATKTFPLSLSGYSQDRGPNNTLNNPDLRLYKGSYRDGKEVSFKGHKNLRPRYIDMERLVVGMLSESPDRLKELKQIPTNGRELETVILEKKLIPNEALGFEMLDYLMIDEFKVATLSDIQQQAILGWVQTGGTLIVGASPDAQQSLGALYGHLPMKSENEGKVNSSFLQTKDALKTTFDELPIFIGKLDQESTIIEKSKDTPVVVAKKFGEGQIVQTAFSLGDAPLAQWNGYSDWFGALLTKVDSHGTQYANQNKGINESLFWELGQWSEYFNMNAFSIGKLAIILGIYLVIIVPALYVILKKSDKREHAWWVIPLISIITSVGIFGFGAKDRLVKPQLNQLGVYHANDGLLNGYFSTTMLSNTSGDYTLSFKDEMVRGNPGSQNMVNPGRLQHFAVVGQARKGEEVTFPNVEYWSTRTYFGKARKETKGSFETQLTLANKKLEGTIKNNFPYDFKQLTLWSGNKKINLGQIKKGETIQVKQMIEMDFLSAPLVSQNQNVYPNPNTNMKLEQLQSNALTNVLSNYLAQNNQKDHQPILFGITNDEILQQEIEGKRSKNHSLATIYHSIDVEQHFAGSFELKNNSLVTNLIPIQGMIIDERIGSSIEVALDDGKYEYQVQLPKQLLTDKTKINEISFEVKEGTAAFYLKNVKTGKSEPFPVQNKPIVYTGEQLTQYIAKDGIITIEVDKKGGQQKDPYVRLPRVTIKGEVSK